MRKENRIIIDKEIEYMNTIDCLKVNLKEINKAIKLYNLSEEEYRKHYTSNNFNLKELKYFRSEMRKKLKKLEGKEK